MKELFFVPVGGLGNRMRAVASAVSLAREKKSSVQVGWFRDWALNASFSDLFEMPDMIGVKISDVPFVYYWTLDRPRRKNLFVPRVFQRWIFDRCFYEPEMTALYQKKEDVGRYALEGRIYMACCYPFHAYERALILQLFRPNALIRKRLEERCAAFSEYTIGVHVRRTDNIVSIKESPLELFFQAIETEKREHDSLKVFLATDSEEVKQEMYRRYGDMIITSEAKADRDSVEGIRDGLVDLYSLAATCKIYGSFGSSFSELAAELGGIPLALLRKKV